MPSKGRCQSSACERKRHVRPPPRPLLQIKRPISKPGAQQRNSGGGPGGTALVLRRTLSNLAASTERLREAAVGYCQSHTYLPTLISKVRSLRAWGRAWSGSKQREGRHSVSLPGSVAPL